MRRPMRDIFPGKIDGPFRWPHLATNNVEQSGFSRSVRTYNADNFLFCNQEVDIVQHFVSIEVNTNVSES